MEPILEGDGQNTIVTCISRDEALDFLFPKLSTLSKSVRPLSRKRGSKVTENQHNIAICCRPVAAGDGISGQDLNSV